jgi:hypothetical protein
METRRNVRSYLARLAERGLTTQPEPS